MLLDLLVLMVWHRSVLVGFGRLLVVVVLVVARQLLTIERNCPKNATFAPRMMPTCNWHDMIRAVVRIAIALLVELLRLLLLLLLG